MKGSRIYFWNIIPAFKGNRVSFSLQLYDKDGCTFLKNGWCEPYGRRVNPMECKFFHYPEKGYGINCDIDIEKDRNHESGVDLAKTGSQNSIIKVKKTSFSLLISSHKLYSPFREIFYLLVYSIIAGLIKSGLKE